MLLGRWNVAVRSVGQLDVHGRHQRTVGFDFQTSESNHFIRQRSDTKSSDAGRLQLQLTLLSLVQMNRFSRVNFRQGRWQPVTERRHHFNCPRQTSGIGRAVFQSERALSHFERHPVAPLYLADGPGRPLRHFPGKGVVVQIVRRRSIITSPQIATGPLRHHPDKLRTGPQLGGQMPGKTTEII